MTKLLSQRTHNPCVVHTNLGNHSYTACLHGRDPLPQKAPVQREHPESDSMWPVFSGGQEPRAQRRGLFSTPQRTMALSSFSVWISFLCPFLLLLRAQASWKPDPGIKGPGDKTPFMRSTVPISERGNWGLKLGLLSSVPLCAWVSMLLVI